MKKQWLLISVALMCSAVAHPGFAQDEGGAGQGPVGQVGGDILITATKRSQPLADVPIAVSAVSGEVLENTGASDIRQLNQVSPSLLVSSSTSEAGAGAARIRGIGTVGDNPGLESSVATFIDGVYRSRSGVGLTELGDIDRVEVLRGPQGTLFGRNASAGLINIVTAAPEFEFGGKASLTYGNYDAMRATGSVTGPLVADTLAARVDGIYFSRDGFQTDTNSGRDLNDRNRYLVRGQLLYTPNEDISLRLIGDFSKRNEECCAASYLEANNFSLNGSGQIMRTPSTLEGAFALLGAPINDDTFDRDSHVTPGRSYNSDVEDWGLSGQLDWDLGAVQATAITAYRNWTLNQALDADYNTLDILYRDAFDQKFRTFSQEVRFQGDWGKLDWLIGGFYMKEKLDLSDNLSFGNDYNLFTTTLIRASNPALAAFPGFTGLTGFVNASVQAQLLGNGATSGQASALAGQISALVPSFSLSNTGIVRDSYQQDGENWAIFTHNIFNVTDKLAVTVGARYTVDRKKLDAQLLSDATGCTQLVTAAQNVASLAPGNPAAASTAGLLSSLARLPCAANTATLFDGNFSDEREEKQWSGTAVVSYKWNPELMTYASYSRGYKAGGFNLDRAGIDFPNAGIAAQEPASVPGNGVAEFSDLQFEPEKVHALEMGAKWNNRFYGVNVAAFYQIFEQFQLNTFNGVNFVVENIQSCKEPLGAAKVVSGVAYASGNCAGDTVGGVTSKGIEIEGFAQPVDGLMLTGGITIADTQYRNNLVGNGGRGLTAALFQLPGSHVSNAPEYVLTGSAAYAMPLGDSGYESLFYVDFRYQSDFNTGSDLDIEKEQDGFLLVNARLGLYTENKRWGLELWAQNLLDTHYVQVAFDSPLQGNQAARAGLEVPAGQAGATTSSSQLYSAFLGEPRTFGVTLKARF